jgi:hypothetical protein
MEVPAQPALEAGALFDQVISVIDQKAKLSGFAVESDHGEVRFAQGSSS